MGWPTSWWPLEKIKPISEEVETPLGPSVVASKAHQYMVFAEYAAWCMAWAISCTEDENHGWIFVINGSNDRFVADNFSDFIDWHIADVNALL